MRAGRVRESYLQEVLRIGVVVSCRVLLDHRPTRPRRRLPCCSHLARAVSQKVPYRSYAASGRTPALTAARMSFSVDYVESFA
jgi:hypothetical protein